MQQHWSHRVDFTQGSADMYERSQALQSVFKDGSDPWLIETTDRNSGIKWRKCLLFMWELNNWAAIFRASKKEGQDESPRLLETRNELVEIEILYNLVSK